MRTPAAFAVLLGAAGLVSVPGCSTPPPDPSASARLAPEYDKDTGRLTRIAYDADGNGTHDTWAYMDGSRLIKLEADENENGRIDRWEYYPANAGPARVPPERIDRSTADDGRVTRKEYFDGTEMVRVEEYTDGIGALDKWESYTAGALTVLSLDENGDGKPDRKLFYTPEGALDRVEVDETGSGQFRRVAS